MINCQCRVAKSLHREKYDELRFKKNFTFEQLAEVSKQLGENISKATFFRHYTYHVKPALETYVRMNASEEWLKARAKEELDMYSEIMSNLSILREKVEEACKLPLSAPNIAALTNLAGEIRKTLQYIVENKEKLVGVRNELTEDILLSHLVQIIDELPPEQREKLKARVEALVSIT